MTLMATEAPLVADKSFSTDLTEGTLPHGCDYSSFWIMCGLTVGANL